VGSRASVHIMMKSEVPESVSKQFSVIHSTTLLGVPGYTQYISHLSHLHIHSISELFILSGFIPLPLIQLVILALLFKNCEYEYIYYTS
jgi:cellobiose-specific phosphotransferase system component IIC